MSSKREYSRGSGKLDKLIAIPAILIVICISMLLAFKPQLGSQSVKFAFNFVTTHFTWMFLGFGAFCFIFLIYLALGRYGNVKLAVADEKPEFSTVAWVSMLFCAGVGIGLMIFGFVEPLYYYVKPPLGIEPKSETALLWAHMLPQFHWGFSAWTIYCMPTIAVALSIYVRKEPSLRISTSCRAVLGSLVDGPLGSLIEVLILLGTVAAVGTSLGLAVPLVATLISEVTGLSNTFGMKVSILAVWFFVYGASSYLGLAKGMQNLSKLNIWLGFFILAFILFVGPTTFILDLWLNSFGLLLNNLGQLIFQTEPLRTITPGATAGWVQSWTVFYWAWWVAYAPVTALFVARISRGRTIRQVIIAECVFGSLGCWVFLAFFGAYGLYVQQSGLVDLIGMREAGIWDDPSTCAAIIKTLPLKWIIFPVYTILCIVFLATTLDSSSYTLASICIKDLKSGQAPVRWLRVLWAALLAAFGLGLLITGGSESLETVKTSTLVGGIILVPILLIMAWSCMRILKEDFPSDKLKS